MSRKKKPGAEPDASQVEAEASTEAAAEATDVAEAASDEVDLTMVTMTFDALDPGRLQSVLARYVVLSRGHQGCRNIDLCLSSTKPNRFVVVQKWERPADQQAHFDSPDMVAMAAGCTGLLAGPPEIDLLDPISAHDLH